MSMAESKMWIAAEEDCDLLFIKYLLVVLYLFNCSSNFRCKLLRIDIANKTCLLLKITGSIEPHPL